MNFLSDTKFMAIMLAAALAGFFLLISQKSHQAEPAPVANERVSSQSSTSFYAEAEARHQQQLESQSQMEETDKKRKAKENSVECQFWKQQKSEKSPARVDEKIQEFCVL